MKNNFANEIRAKWYFKNEIRVEQPMFGSIAIAPQL
jgi:hypothetical protein